MKTAADLMTPDPPAVRRTRRCEFSARLMVQHNCGEVPVDTDGQLIGVVTDRDIVCRVLASGKNPLEHTAQDCMSQPAITVHPDTTITDVMTTMEVHQIRRVPVVDAHERCVGIVPQADLAVGRAAGGGWRCWYGQCPGTPTCRRADHRWPTDAPLPPSGRSN